ncbi:hypothetical protein OEZ85_002972 [Tetradesmus obliquus]|uniref:Activator of Hsp90 ATPase N-terminal domain-containing protein n=1 Tax=Tetradesmus obliquus TaxID=3088 RepID=A0ABY8U1X1_TETOB|nr:hypothetical protein OEZ85_002972 [Tetradesmus obliquus]
MSLAPPSPQRSRKRLSDSGAGKPQWLQQLPRLSAEHHRVFQSVQKLTLKAALDLSSCKYSAEAIWFAKWEGQPARLKFKWSEGSPNALLFDAAVAIRGSSSRKLRLIGTPHQLHTASIMLGPTAGPSVSSSSSSSSSSADASPGLEVPAAEAAAPYAAALEGLRMQWIQNAVSVEDLLTGLIKRAQEQEQQLVRQSAAAEARAAAAEARATAAEARAAAAEARAAAAEASARFEPP